MRLRTACAMHSCITPHLQNSNKAYAAAGARFAAADANAFVPLCNAQRIARAEAWLAAIAARAVSAGAVDKAIRACPLGMRGNEKHLLGRRPVQRRRGCRAEGNDCDLPPSSPAACCQRKEFGPAKRHTTWGRDLKAVGEADVVGDAPQALEAGGAGSDAIHAGLPFAGGGITKVVDIGKCRGSSRASSGCRHMHSSNGWAAAGSSNFDVVGNPATSPCRPPPRPGITHQAA